MRRGDIYSAATGHGFGSKPRPVLIVQADSYVQAPLVLVALIGSSFDEGPAIRPRISPDAENNLRKDSTVMIDVIAPVRHEKFGRHIGRLAQADMRRVESAMLTYLGFARSPG